MKHLLYTICLVFFFMGYCLCAFGQILTKSHYQLNQEQPYKITSNAINDILIDEEDVWIGTANALIKMIDNGDSMLVYTHAEDSIGKGGITALAEKNDTIWIATGFDTLTDLGHLPAGGGIGYMVEGDSIWHWFPQPVDPKDAVGYEPTTVTIQNLTYDIAISHSAVWITSWAGGLRKSTDHGETWEIVTVDGYPLDVLGRLTHRTFAVIFDGKALWVGSAGGIHKSTDEGETWTTFSHQNQAQGISGNFVVAIAQQKTSEKEIIWASTIEAEDVDEYRGISKTEDGGYTWTVMLEGEFAHNFAIDGKEVYVVTDNGLYKSVDYGETWALFPQIIDKKQDRKIYTTEMYSVAVDTIGRELWVGTADGLAMSEDFGFSWTIFRAYETPGKNKNPDTYAYPNPFSPMRHNRFGADGHVRFKYTIESSTSITIRVYDFGMNLVQTVVENKHRLEPGNYDEIWNGRNELGDLVANGVYFYQIRFTNQETVWGKVIVID
jgi:photosystem II stability/assembly factor-like uncharacterized protein